MEATWNGEKLTTASNDDDSNKTLDELFGCASSEIISAENRTDSEALTKTLRGNGMDTSEQGHCGIIDHDYDIDNPSGDESIFHDYENTKGLNLIPSEHVKDGTDKMDDHDYENTKGLDLSFVSEKSPFETDNISKASRQETIHDDDYETFETEQKELPSAHVESKEIRRQSSRAHSYENTKELNLELPCETDTTATAPSKDEALKNKKEFQKKDSRSHSYENTNDMNLELTCEKEDTTIDERSKRLRSHSYENTEHITFKPETEIKATSLNEDERLRRTGGGVRYENTTLVSSQETSSTQNSNVVCDINTAQLQHGIATSPLEKKRHTLTKTEQLVQGMCHGRLSPIGMEEEHLHQEEPYYTCMDENNDIYCTADDLDKTFKDKNDAVSYMAMDESIFESSLYENDSSDGAETEHLVNERRDSCYEEIDMPPPNSKMNPTTCDRRGKGDGSSKDVDSDLHYQEVDLSSVICGQRGRIPSDNAYEDVDIPYRDSPEMQPRELATRPTPPQRRPRQRKDNGGEGETSGFDINQNISTPSSLDEIDVTLMKGGEPMLSKSPDFEDIDALRLHMAMKDSIGQALFKKASCVGVPWHAIWNETSKRNQSSCLTT
ncbi:hypothetical protein QZH41_003172 [Actinostola sp. cb2023]|nr:hypothetical protein QZH41_003172 [Actinostola sp. cb2023]